MWEVKLADQSYRTFKERICKKEGRNMEPVYDESTLVYQFGISIIINYIF
jgi:hypothetical protein